MIHDLKGRWVVCTPAKNGSKSITSALRHVSEKVTPMNRADAPDSFKERIMCVRHPLDRWVSMYLWAARDGAWAHKFAVQGVVTYAEHFLKTIESGGTGRRDSDVMWLWPQNTIAYVFKPTLLFDNVVDGGQAMLTYMSETYGYHLNDVMPPINVTSGRPTSASVLDQLPAALRIGIVTHYDADFEWFKACGLTYERY
jgi:hypothetical protein